MEGIGHDLQCPDQSGGHVAQKEQVDRTEDQPAEADIQPDQSEALEVTSTDHFLLQQTQKIGAEVEGHRRHRPQRHEDYLASQVVANLDVLLVLVGRPIHVVIPARFKEEMPGLARGHRDAPRDEGREGRIDEKEHVGDHEGQGADEVQRLVDPAVVVVAVVVPALGAQRFEVVGKRSGHDAVHGVVDDADRWIGLVSISMRLC